MDRCVSTNWISSILVLSLLYNNIFQLILYSTIYLHYLCFIIYWHIMRKVFLSLIFMLLGFIYSEACTNFIVGKAASKDGSTIVSYSADSFNMFGELYHYRAGIHPDGSLRDIVDWRGRYL